MQGCNREKSIEPTAGEEDLETELMSKKYWRLETVRKELGNMREN